jgi:hypothetical protein
MRGLTSDERACLELAAAHQCGREVPCSDALFLPLLRMVVRGLIVDHGCRGPDKAACITPAGRTALACHVAAERTVEA